MACYRPITCWKPLDGGPVSFSEKKDCREIAIKCGQCIGCRIDKREEWAVRCYAESKMHKSNCFVTLTYSDDNIPPLYSLNYRDFQLFMYRLRQKCGPVRFFMCGEYGEQLGRPHYHALFFGLDFADKRKSNSVYSDFDLYESETLTKLWDKGHSTIGELTYESARYCAVYATKKIVGDKAEDHYFTVDERTGECGLRVPEFARMSLKPGIGEAWLRKYWPDLYVTGHNAVLVNGSRKKIPRFFDKKMDEIAPLLMDDVEYKRFKEVNHENNTRERLAVRENCAKAKERFNLERKMS